MITGFIPFIAEGLLHAVDPPEPLLLANKTSNSVVAAGSSIQMQAEVYDPENIIAVTSDTATINADGFYSFAMSEDHTGAKILLRGIVNDAAAYGMPKCFEDNIAAGFLTGHGGLLTLENGDTVELQNETTVGTSTYIGGDSTWMNILRHDPNTWHCLARKNAAQGFGGSGTDDVTYQVNVTSRGVWHDEVTDTEDFIVPAGVDRIQVVSNTIVEFAVAEAELTLNGAFGTKGFPRGGEDVGALGSCPINLLSAIIPVSEGDIIRTSATLFSANNILANEGTWMCIYEVPASVKSCLAYNSGNFTLTTTPQAITCDTESYDDDSIHSTSSNTSRFTCPAGCNWGRLIYWVAGTASDTDRMVMETNKNGSAFTGKAVDGNTGRTSIKAYCHGASAVVAMTPGDYLELKGSTVSGTVATTDLWVSAEFWA